MKNLIIALFLLLSFKEASSQNYYKAKMTEMYTYNTTAEKWELYSKNSDTDITIVVETKFITIQAKSPTMYRVYDNTKQDLNRESVKGYRYEAKNLKEGIDVTIDVLNSVSTDLMVLSIINYDKGVNLRYYIVPTE